jgi:hypothetical protein
MQGAQVIEKNIHESGVDLLFPIHSPKHKKKDVEEKFDKRCENFSTSDYVPKDKSGKNNFLIQE